MNGGNCDLSNCCAFRPTFAVVTLTSVVRTAEDPCDDEDDDVDDGVVILDGFGIDLTSADET